MRLVIIAVITTAFQLWSASALPQGASSTDPCESSPCGKGAECKPMGSIAVCICPDNNTGDPFVQCMGQTSNHSDTTDDPSSTLGALASAIQTHQYVTAFDIATGHQPRTAESTTSSTSTPSTTTTTRPPPPSSTTTSSPVPHEPPNSNSRPATLGHNSRPPYHHNGGGYQSQPESHRIPIISEDRGTGNSPHTYHHNYPPRPIASYGTGTAVFTDKTYGGPFVDNFGVTDSYSHRGQTGHVSGSHGYHHHHPSSSYGDYDRRPIAGPSYDVLPSSRPESYGHHGYHPAASGFPGPITESSNSHRYGGNYSPVRNDLYGSGTATDDVFTRVPDPLGKYENCRLVNGIVLCADNVVQNRGGDSGYIHSDTTANYGSYSSRDRDQFSSYYPIPSPSSRYPSSSSTMSSGYNDFGFSNRHGYPHHGTRQPLDDTTSYYPFSAQEQRLSTQSVHAISPPGAVSVSTTLRTKSDNDHPLCRAMCGVNSVCRIVLERPVCGCPQDHTGDPAVRCDPVESKGPYRGHGGCERHVDCAETEICAKSNRCVDPCKEQEHIGSVISADFSGSSRDNGGMTSLCGKNSECLVVGHTPLCKCRQGFFGNPYVACVP